MTPTGGCPARTTTASDAYAAALTRSATIITRWRGNRSATTPPKRITTTSGPVYAARTSPSSRADPVSSVRYRGIATSTRRSPTVLTDCPIHSRRNSRWLSTRGYFVRRAGTRVWSRGLRVHAPVGIGEALDALVDLLRPHA